MTPTVLPSLLNHQVFPSLLACAISIHICYKFFFFQNLSWLLFPPFLSFFYNFLAKLLEMFLHTYLSSLSLLTFWPTVISLLSPPRYWSCSCSFSAQSVTFLEPLVFIFSISISHALPLPKCHLLYTCFDLIKADHTRSLFYNHLNFLQFSTCTNSKKYLFICCIIWGHVHFL